jgi:hypothetical protein
LDGFFFIFSEEEEERREIVETEREKISGQRRVWFLCSTPMGLKPLREKAAMRQR